MIPENRTSSTKNYRSLQKYYRKNVLKADFWNSFSFLQLFHKNEKVGVSLSLQTTGIPSAKVPSQT